MIERALIHVAGPPGGGKTTLIEQLLAAESGASCVRALQDTSLGRERESAPKSHPELRRYWAAGAESVALYRFGEFNLEAFYDTRVMELSVVMLIEGDFATEYADCSVFVAPVPARGSLLRRVLRDHTAAHEAKIEELARAVESPEETARFFGKLMGEAFMAAIATSSTDSIERTRQELSAHFDKIRHLPPPRPPSTGRWRRATRVSSAPSSW